MEITKRKKLNHAVRALAHGTLGLTDDEYRCIVYSVDPKSNGHITHCDDEYANLIYMQLKRMAAGGGSTQNLQQQKMIARLMDYLHWTWANTAHFCYKITGHRTTRMCSSSELSKVIRGMVAIINHDLQNGKLIMSDMERLEFEKHTKTYGVEK